MELIKFLSEFVAFFLIWTAIDYKRGTTSQKLFSKGFWVQLSLLLTAVLILKLVYKA